MLGVYFIGLWTRAGQTLAMKTWHLRVLTDRGLPLTPRRALARYLASYVWFLPPLALAGALKLPSAWAIFGLVAGWIVLYALSALLHPRRQFWHDALCDTAIVIGPPVRAAAAIGLAPARASPRARQSRRCSHSVSIAARAAATIRATPKPPARSAPPSATAAIGSSTAAATPA